MQRLANKAQAQQQQPAFEKTIQFSYAQAIVWEIKFLINNINSKKALTTANAELTNLAQHFGKDFDKYLLKELIEQIDLKDPNKASKDKNEPFKVQLLNQELARSSQQPEFLQYFSEIAQGIFHDRYSDFLNELTKRLRLNFPTQLLIALSLSESCKEDTWDEAIKLLKQKLIDYHNYGKPEPLPDFAVHRLIWLLNAHPDLNSDETLRDICQYIIDSNPLKPNSHVALRSALQQDLLYANTNPDEPSVSLIKEGTGLDNLDKANKMLEPWQLLLDLGHYSTYNYNYLMMALQDFKDINEKTMVKTLLYLSIHNTGTEDPNSRIVYNTFEANKKGEYSQIKKEAGDKKTQIQWSIENLARAFRELCANLSWLKVFEALREVEDDIELDQKAYLYFLQIFNKSKPQNLQFPIQALIDTEWANTRLQLNFIDNTITCFQEKKDKSIAFTRLTRKQENVDELAGIKEKVQPEMLQVWLCIELVERLISLSTRQNFAKVRHIFEAPLKLIPEYLLLTVSLTKPMQGNLMIDELLSLLLPQFLGNHINSIPVLQHLWKNNQALMIRGICELCRHDQRIMNLSRVLDITQEVKESLIPIVDCEDYFFAVNLGILAGKRDFLHYDVWLQSRIKEVGTPFIKALLKYIKDHIITPINEYKKRHSHATTAQLEVSEDQLESFKAQVLERSHLSKEKLCITLEHLQNPSNNQNPKIKSDTVEQISEVVYKTTELFPSQAIPSQNSEEIDNAANEYFQTVFSAEPEQVDQKITELIDTMQKFKESDVKKEQEIYACMLHSLFDEYRFLHRYPLPYLEKIAKLFGAIIKNRIIDGTLQDIALKFAFEAFRREGKRQKFGIITTKQFFEMLPQFPQFFKDIYDTRHQLAQSDPKFMQDIERLYERTKAQEEKEREQKQREEQLVKQQEDQKKKAAQPAQHSEDKQQVFYPQARLQQQQQEKKTEQQQPASQMPKFDNNFLNVLQNVEQIQKQLPLTTPQQVPTFIPTSQQIKPQATAPGKSMMAGDQSSLPRTSTPLQNQAPIFIPTKKQQQMQQQNPSLPTGLNVQSEAFKVNYSSSLPSAQTSSLSTMNTNVQTFKPTRPQSVVNTALSPSLQQFQSTMDAKIQKALTDNTKLRLEDLLDDPAMAGPNETVQEQIKFICNNTGKNNFLAKLQDLKQLIEGNIINLDWLIQYILTKRIQSSNLFPIYIELLKQVGMKESIPHTINQAFELFKKCMLVDEELFARVVRSNVQGSQIKVYLANLGQFLGGITIASNRPILSREIDLKQLLLEAYTNQDKLKYVITFVCRILKECTKSSIFKVSNPWIAALLSLLREIYDATEQMKLQAQNEVLMEIDATFKQLSIPNVKDVPHSGILKALQTQQYASPFQQQELTYLLSKNNLIPQVSSASQSTTATTTSRQDLSSSLTAVPSSTAADDVIQQIRQVNNQIYQRVVVSPELQANIKKYMTALTDQQIKNMVGDAVDSSIVDILPPVVDRSVTIALITTRELVLKDFAYDGDYNKVLKAADLIVQNLAGSLALVTCREPLKMSLSTNLKKSLVTITSQQQQEIPEAQLVEIAAMASKENLELGCKLIKEAVIEKALKKVREDQQILKAIEKRKRHQEMQGLANFRDETVIAQFSELPPQLQPNPNGLTDAQFQVYEDFAKLNILSSKGDAIEGGQQPQQPQLQSTDLEQLLSFIDQSTSLNENIINALTMKLAKMNQTVLQEEKTKLQAYVEKWFTALCQKFDESSVDNVQHLVDLLGYIVKQYKVEDFSKELTHQLLQSKESLINNVDLNLILMKNGIISISEWDKQVSIFLSDNPGQLSDNVYQFFRDFLIASIEKAKVLTYTQVPNLINVILKLSQNPNIAPFFVEVIEEMKKKQLPPNNQSILRDYFIEWVAMSQGESSPNQEQEINKFFSNLTKTDIFKDTEMMANFCKITVQTSIEKALYTNTGEKRPNDRLDYRFIESFIKMIVVLLMTSEFNKHEFMNKVFEAIHEVLDQDHAAHKTQFNQKPYYRMLMNILTAVNHSQCFNQKTHLLILFSLADLFNKLNPNKYPAFAFAWLELISHKQFMPHFLKQAQQQQQQYLNQNQTVQQQLDNTFYQKWFKFKELIVHLFSFLKNNMLPQQKTPMSLMRFYEATLRVCLVIVYDYPEFFCDFHFNFVNSLPDHCIQLKNIVLSAFPSDIQPPNPFTRNLKVDLLQEVKQGPRILSNYDNYLALMNLKEDLENYFKTKNPRLINVICDKMMQSEEIINGRRKINSSVINAVVLFIANQVQSRPTFEQSQKESMDLFKQMIHKLNDETRWVFLNAIVNELRYPNTHTYYFSCIFLYLFVECQSLVTQEQIAKILFERLQVNRPHPWGLMISFRELIQNHKYQFMKKPFIQKNQQAVDLLFETKLRSFLPFNPHYKQPQQQQQQQPMNYIQQQQQDLQHH